jgi:hypothetical protein
MGGPGSGSWVRWDKKGIIEDYPRLDVRELHKEHGINPENEIALKYKLQGEQVVQEIFLDWTACNFGGCRPWLICMTCGRRVAVLYLRGKYFACRHCCNLTYSSCQESDKRFSKFLQKHHSSGDEEDMPLYALKGWLSRAQRGKERLKKEMNRRRRGRPPKKAHGPQGDLG